jgi:hypothetical protein
VSASRTTRVCPAHLELPHIVDDKQAVVLREHSCAGVAGKVQNDHLGELAQPLDFTQLTQAAVGCTQTAEDKLCS